jgi:hypothetical protein
METPLSASCLTGESSGTATPYAECRSAIPIHIMQVHRDNGRIVFD